jgi:mono/diheme cytochrome c family protein
VLTALGLAIGLGALGFFLGRATAPEKNNAPAPATTTASPGAAVFASAGCGACHTLGAAHASGAVGPNLDQLKPDPATVQTKVKQGGGGMPSFSGQLTEQQIKDVATFVASNAGK